MIFVLRCIDFLNNLMQTKVGMFGGPGGFNHDTPTVPERLESVTIQSDDVLTSIAFSYIDEDGQLKNAGPWGFDGANSNTVSAFLIDTSYMYYILCRIRYTPSDPKRVSPVVLVFVPN